MAKFDGLTVEELIEKLQKFPPKHKVKFYEKGSVYDSNIIRVFESKYDKDNNRNQVTLSN